MAEYEYVGMTALNWNYVHERIFVPKREKVTVDWREFHKEELHNLYSSCNISGAIKFIK
jgi:hypothetical protein